MKIKKRVIPILFLLLAACNKLSAQNFTVKGIVIEKRNNVPIEFASISIINKTDASIVSGTVTNINGTFSIPLSNTGNYLLKVVSIGCETLNIYFLFSNKKSVIDLGTIQLKL